MKTFALGIIAGTVIGAGAVLTVHPINKRKVKKLCRRAEKIMNKMSCGFHGDVF